jgi:DNA-binding HxlR family transcriptional regulator
MIPKWDSQIEIMVVKISFKPSILNDQHVAAIIQFLSERGEARASELKLVSGNYDKLKAITNNLESLGLVDIRMEEKPRLTYIYSLTEKGKKVAGKLVEIDKIITET